MSYFVKVVIWFVCLMFVLDLSCELITTTSTIANILAVAIMTAMAAITLVTKCFTIITFKKHKDEKSN